ncbi:sulfurtransferase [Candidatus Methanocrinis natronophilus]|uniref:Rhodanese domain-containing protein n=1 Tax=Candidatus Methanocrinis natronophilus TaxID=3033396 RepID=A0ABT5X571_9EURY|nr:rhodanese-like domain-containing protein [Candidatus Methanocrinis natronophilus]MDF0589798.1 hypothetical protein [Candidatus Methanocrinis natronophilus]
MALIILAVGVVGTDTAAAAPYCCTVGGYGGWSGADFLKDTPPISPVTGSISAPASAEAASETIGRNVETSGMVLNVFNDPESRIPEAVQIDYRDLMDGSGMPRSICELSEILGKAGLSRDDSVSVYSDDPFVATFVYLILDYLGQERIEILEDANEIKESGPMAKSPTDYNPAPRRDLIVNFESFDGDGTQVVDARPSEEQSAEPLPGSRKIPYVAVLADGRIKGKAELADLFSEIEIDEPVAVYSDDAFHASAVWYALKREGYDPRIFTGDDWSTNLANN